MVLVDAVSAVGDGPFKIVERPLQLGQRDMEIPGDIPQHALAFLGDEGGFQFKAGQGGEWDSRLTFGHNEYGGEALSNYLRFDGGRTVMLKGGQEMRFGLLVEDQHRLDADKNSALVRGINLDWSRPLGAGTARLGARLTDVAADAVEIAHVSRGVSLGYDFAKPVLGASLSVTLGYEERDYGAIWTVPEGRADERVSVDARAHLRQLDYMGFAPEVGVNYTRNRSNSVLHDSREMGLSLGIKSTF